MPSLCTLEHQPVRLLEAEAEELLEDEGDVRHEVDRVVPDDHDPRPLLLDPFVRGGLLNLDLGRRDDRAHGPIVADKLCGATERKNAAEKAAPTLSTLILGMPTCFQALVHGRELAGVAVPLLTLSTPLFRTLLPHSLPPTLVRVLLRELSRT